MDAIEAKQKKEVAKTETDLDSLAKSLDQQTAEIKAKTPLAPASITKPGAINLSVKDVNSAAQKHQEASQTQPPQAKKGFLGIFK